MSLEIEPQPRPTDGKRLRQACGDLGGLYLNPEGIFVSSPDFERIGMTRELVYRVRERGEHILIVGAQPERVDITFAALEANLPSILITDLLFAHKLLEKAKMTS